MRILTTAAVFTLAACGPQVAPSSTEDLPGDNATGAESAAATSPVFQCRGTEPFWGLELTPTSAELTRVGDQPEPALTLFTGGWSRIDWEESVYEWRGARSGGDGAAFNVVIRGESCQGPRPQEYPYSVYFDAGSGSHGEPGCCEMKE